MSKFIEVARDLGKRIGVLRSAHVSEEVDSTKVSESRLQTWVREGELAGHNLDHSNRRATYEQRRIAADFSVT